MKYTLHKITFEEVKSILGEEDRQVFRYLNRQREMLKNYLLEKEVEYFSKYPFENDAFFYYEIKERL